MSGEKENKSTSYFKILSVSESDRKTKKHCLGEVAVHLNAYEDIFSDFDPRPFSERSLSDDFLLELRKASKVKGHEPLHLSFMLDDSKRNLREETMIRKRLIDYAKKHIETVKEDMWKTRNKNLLFIAIGACLTLGATYLHSIGSESFLKNLVFVLMEPAGWFFTWTGFERIVETRSHHHEQIAFYEKLEEAEITFTSY